VIDYGNLQSRLTLVKQSIAQMLNLMDSKARIALYTFSGAVGNGNPFSTLAADDGKINFMDRIPNNDSPAFSSKLSPEMAKRAQNPNNLYFALNTTIAELNVSPGIHTLVNSKHKRKCSKFRHSESMI
jgi:hypothetical protein